MAQTEKKISLATVESDQKVAENKRKLTDIEHELQVQKDVLKKIDEQKQKAIVQKDQETKALSEKEKAQ